MSSASSPEPLPTGHYNPEYLASLEPSNTGKPQLSLCGEADNDSDPAPNGQGLRREESKLVGLYAITLFSGLLLLSGLGVMLSEDIPKWISQAHNQPITLFSDGPANRVNSITLVDRPVPQLGSGNAHTKAIAFPKLPDRYAPVWSQHTFDKSSRPITVLVLKTPFKMSQTANRSGLEYFAYNAYLLRQVASQMQDNSLRQKISQLAKLSDRMASNLELAIYSEFNGIPSGNLAHLASEAKARRALQSITANPLQILHSDRAGNAIQAPETANFQPGYELQAYLDTLKEIIHSKTMRQDYPDTTALLVSQGNRIQKIAENLSLRWESRLSCLKAACQKSPDNARVYAMHIYVRQTLNDYT